MTSNSNPTSQVPAEAEIDPIRVELLSTEMPIHQLAKRGEEDIRILKRDRNGQVKLQWRVDYNPNVGRPGQLAYRLDTWVIKRRLNELRRPLPRLVRIGDLREIARELKHGGDTNAVRQAFEQNAATFIRAKITYRTKGKGEETLEGYFNRYNVFYRGHPLPGGRRAETVYIGLNDPYYGLLNRPEIRPLDFAYLRQLKPAAQRFYELLSPKVFAALRNGYPAAWIRYSQYCQYAVQKPQPNRSRMQAQMARVQGAHRRSGYIASVNYRSFTTTDGSLDWIIEYKPGSRARAEYCFFNERKTPRRRSEPLMDESTPQSGLKRAPEGARTRNSGRSNPDPAELLARRFAERRYGAGPVIQPTPRQTERAQQLLNAAAGDLEIAETAVDLAAKEGRDDRKGYPKHLGGVLEAGYVHRACELRNREKAQRQRQADAERERERRTRYEDWCRQRAAKRIAQLSDMDRSRIIDERLVTFTKQNRYLDTLSWSDDRKKTWTEKRILQQYGRDREPSYDDWCREHDPAPLH